MFCNILATIFLVLLSASTVSAKIPAYHEAVFQMAQAFRDNERGKDIVFHFHGSGWSNSIRQFYKSVINYFPMGATSQLDPLEMSYGNGRTVNVYVEDNLDNFVTLMSADSMISKDYWLVSVSGSDWKSVLDSLDMNFMSRVFPFQYHSSNNSFTMWETYKINVNDSQAQILLHGNWQSTIGLDIDQSNIWHRRADMKGVYFRIAALPNQPYVTVAENDCRSSECFKGMYPDVWHTLQNIMNFTYLLNRPPDRSWGTLKDGKWNGMIAQLVNDEIDIAPAEFTITQIRSTAVDFLVPIAESHQRLFVKNPADALNWMAFIQPLTWTSWGVLSLLIMAVPLIVAALMYSGDEPSRDEFTLSKTFWFVSGAMTIARGWSHTPVTIPNRIAFYTVILNGALIYWHWEAMLISYLAVRTIVLPFNSIEELASKTDINVVVQPGTSYVDTFRYGNNEVLQQIWTERIEPYIDTYPRGKRNLSQYIVENNGFALFDNFYASRSYDFYLNCETIDIPIAYFPVQFAYGIQKESPYFDIFWFHMNKLKENGAFKQIRDSYETQPQVCPDYSGQPLAWSQCFTAFICLVMGAAFGLLWLCIELVVPRPVLMSFMSLGNRTYDSIFGRESMLESQNPYIGTKWAKKDATVYVRSLTRSQLEDRVLYLEKKNRVNLDKIRKLESAILGSLTSLKKKH